MKRYVWATSFALTLLAMVPQAEAGPWTKAPGEAYIKYSQLFFGSDTFIDAQGNRVTGTDYAATTASIYAEFGIIPNVHAQVFVPYILSRNFFEAEETSYANVGFGDTLLALQWTPIKTKIPWAIKLEAKLPFYDLGSIEGPRASQFPALGEGQLDVTLWGSVGGSFYPLPLYALAEIGYRHRTAIFFGEDNGVRYLDTVAFNGQVGATLGKRFLIALNVGGTLALGDDQVTQSFVTLGPAVAIYLWDKLALEANASPMIYSRNNSPGTTYSLGLSYQL